MSAGPSQIMTGSGIYFDLASPKAADVRLEDIDQALNRIVRFNGHTRRPITVAEHCLRVRRISVLIYGQDKARESLALLHDAAEAYIGDLVRPLKRGLSWFDREFWDSERGSGFLHPSRGEIEAMKQSYTSKIADLENKILEAIFMRAAQEHGLPCRYETETWDKIKACDNAALYLEAMIEQTGASDWALEVYPWGSNSIGSILPAYAPRDDLGWLGELRSLGS